MSPIEARQRVGEIAEGGEHVAQRVLEDLQAERARQRVNLPHRLSAPTPASADERIETALHAAGGALQSIRDVVDR